MVAFPTVQVLLWHAPTLAKTRTAVISMASCCRLTSSLTMLCHAMPQLDLERTLPFGSTWLHLAQHQHVHPLLPSITLFQSISPPFSATLVIDQVSKMFWTPPRWTSAAASSHPRCCGCEGSPLHWCGCPKDGFGDGQEKRAMAVGWWHSFFGFHNRFSLIFLQV